jgi:hypothetical protein
MAEPQPTDDEVTQLCARLDEAAVGSKNVYEMVGRMSLSDGDRRGPFGQLVMGFQYGAGRRATKPGEPYFTELVGYEDGSRYPPDLPDVPDDVSTLWDRCSKVVTAPLSRARLHDLCFEGHWGDVGPHAFAAAEAHLDLAAKISGDALGQAKATEALAQVASLRRALSLERKTRRTDLETSGQEAFIAAIRRLLATEDFDVGHALVLVEAAIEENVSDDEIDDLLIRLRGEDRDVFFTARVIGEQIVRAAGDDAEKLRLQRELVERWIQEAESSDPARRVWHLTTAADAARNFGLSDLQAEITVKLQETSIEDHGLVRRRVEVPIDQAAAEAYVQEFVDKEDWREALLALLDGIPPSGGAPQNRAAADAMPTIAPLAASLPTTLLGADGLPRFTAVTEEDKAALRLSKQELSKIQILGSLTDEVLRRIGDKWAPIPEDELTQFLSESPHVRDAVAGSLARAFNYYFNDEFEAATYIATPRIESLVRDLVVLVNEPAYRLQRGRTPGQYAGLGALLPILVEQGMDESWVRYLQTLLSGVTGMNYRNDLLHGFVDDVHSGNAALVLVAALFMTRGMKIEMDGGDTK